MDKNEIVIFQDQGIKLEVSLKDQTVWLTQAQMCQLFSIKHNTLSKHISHIFDEGELELATSVGVNDRSSGGRIPKIYNLDVIISVGYRVKAKNGVLFRKWATKVLSDYLLQGYVANKERLQQLEKIITLINVAKNVDDSTYDSELLRVIYQYTTALNLLDDYDYQRVGKISGTTNGIKINYQQCLELIESLRFNETSELFALERSKGLEGIINTIYQTFDGKDVYPSIEAKGANFFYLIIKNHVFIDGNKRIAATLFIYYLQLNKLLYKGDELRIANHTLAALTLLIAQSNPQEKEVMVDIVINFLG